MTSSAIVDGAAMLKPAAAKKLFIPYIILQLHSASCLDLVWDT